MKLNRWIKIILISACVVSLAACASKRKCCSPDDLAINDANSACCANNDPQSSGLGEGSRFGDQPVGRMASNHRTYYFDFDSNVVHDEDKPAIIANAKKLAANPSMKAMLEGHTDPRGSREYNIGLGERRAKSVAQIMASQGVSRDQIRVVSYGAEKLAAAGHTESDYQQDRRGVLVYTK